MRKEPGGQFSLVSQTGSEGHTESMVSREIRAEHSKGTCSSFVPARNRIVLVTFTEVQY